MKPDNAIDAMERLLETATAEDRFFTDTEQKQFDEWKAAAMAAKETEMETQDIEQPTHPTRPLGAPAVHTRQRATSGALLRGAIALACGERGVDTGLASEFDKEVRRRFPNRKFEGAVAMTAKSLFVERVAKDIGALPGSPSGLAAATTGDQWFDSLFFREGDAIFGPRLASALGVQTIVATEERVHITKLTGTVTPTWIARDADVSDSDAVFDAIEAEPKTVGCNVMLKRSALLYGTHPAVEPLMLADLRTAMLSELDRVVFYGEGGLAPEGLETLASQGHTLSTLQDAYKIRDQLIGYQKSDDGMQWLLPTGSQSHLSTTVAFAGATVPALLGGYLAGYKYTLNPLSIGGSPAPATQTYFAGNFSFCSLVLFDAISVLANPYGAGYKSGSIELRVMADAATLCRDSARIFRGDATILA